MSQPAHGRRRRDDPADARGGLAKIAAALRDGEAVVIPFPSPVPYAVAATEASAVNQAKGRPSDQPCGMLRSTADDLAPHLDLDPATVALSSWIAHAEQANLLVPLIPDPVFADARQRWVWTGAGWTSA